MASRAISGLDDIGWRILKALQADARLSFNELGRRVGLSGPAVAERVRRMEEAGIISGYHVAVRLEALFPVQAILAVSAPEENCVALGARAWELEEVIETYRVTGDHRLVVKVVAASVPHLDWVISELGHYGTVTASVILRSRSRAVSRLAPPPAPKPPSAEAGGSRGRRPHAR